METEIGRSECSKEITETQDNISVTTPAVQSFD
jgi:hypothetical protein